MGKIVKVILSIVLIGFIAWIGVNVYSCAVSSRASSQDAFKGIPDAKTAQYTIRVKNTSNLLLSNSYEVSGSQVGSRIFVLHGFWELRGNEFEYKAGDIVLRESVFGEIQVARRQ